MRRLVCIGGWCGPSLAISKLALRKTDDSLSPYEFVRCSFDAITQYTRRSNLSDFFPEPAVADPVGIWLLFRGKHTCFTHFDISNPKIQNDYLQRFSRYKALLEGPIQPLLFVRTIISENPLEEVAEAIEFQKVLDNYPASKDARILLICHDQKYNTCSRIRVDVPRIMLWCLEYDTTPEALAGGLFGKSHSGYERILSYALEDAHWETERDALSWTSPRHHTHLCHVEGVPIFTHSCTGYGTMRLPSIRDETGCECCPHCKDPTSHAVIDVTKWDSSKPWSDEEDEALRGVQLRQTMHEQGLGPKVDVVEAVEGFAQRYNRGANQTLRRMYHLLETCEPGEHLKS